MIRTKRIAICLATDEHDNILMGRRNDNDKWTNPAGKLKVKEDPHFGAKREFLEETGVEADSIKLIGAHWDKDQNLLLYLFKITIKPDQQFDFSKDPDKEFKELKYVNPNDVVTELHVPLEHNIALKYWMNN
jgi:8-oxo-dGTP pyrophosphatase MutT (NUDIX family)